MNNKINIKSLLEEELKKLYTTEGNVQDISIFFNSIFDFIKDRNDKALKRIAGSNLILDEDVRMREAENLFKERKNSVMQNLLTSFILFQNESRIRTLEQQSARQDEKLSTAIMQLDIYKKEAESSKIYTVNRISNDLNISRQRLDMIVNTATDLEEIKASTEAEEKALATIQNNIMGQVETIVREMENLELWPENVEKPIYKRNEKIQKKSFKKSKTLSGEKMNEKEESLNDAIMAETTVEDNKIKVKVGNKNIKVGQDQELNEGSTIIESPNQGKIKDTDEISELAEQNLEIENNKRIIDAPTEVNEKVENEAIQQSLFNKEDN